MVDFSKFPCRTDSGKMRQAGDKASKSVVGSGARDGFIHSRFQGRQEMPHFDSKKDFHV